MLLSHPRTISAVPYDTEGDADSLTARCILIRLLLFGRDKLHTSIIGHRDSLS